MAQKVELKKKYKQFFEVCKETAKIINGTYKEMTNKMWEIGKIIAKKREEVDPKYGSGFLGGICNEMESDVTPNTLGQCERFYNHFPDLLNRVNKSGLTPTHYMRLSQRDLTEEEINKYEKKATEEKLSVRQLEEILPTKKPELILAEALESYNNLVSSLTELRESFVRLQKAKVKGVLSQNQINGLGRTLWVFLRTDLPKMVWFLEKYNAQLDPMFKKYVEKFK